MRRILATWILLGWPAAALAQPPAFAVWERPAAGVFVGASANGDQNSRDTAAAVGFVFDTPVTFGTRARFDYSRTGWTFDQRSLDGTLRLRDRLPSSASAWGC